MNIIYEVNIGQIIVSALSVITILIAIIGWFVNQYLNRRNEKLKRRSECRLDMLHTIIDFRYIFVRKEFFDNDIDELYKKIHLKVQIYGEIEEIKLLNELVKIMEIINSKKQIEETYSKKLVDILNKFVEIAITKIRKELKLKEIYVL